VIDSNDRARDDTALHRRDLIVIGGSAGSMVALQSLVARLPADLPAVVCVAVHMPAYRESRLAEILGRAGSLPSVAATDGAPLRVGTIHVAVADHHLMIQRTESSARMRVIRGPKEHRSRPAVDPLFRSAALAYGARVIGVVLSGALDDGTAGLWTIRDQGGLAVVQDPVDAVVPSMPANALAEVGADFIATAAGIGALLARLVTEMAPSSAMFDASKPHIALDVRAAGRADLEREVAVSLMDDDAHEQSARYGVPSRFACPDCGGVLWDLSHDRGPLRLRCETGHAYSPASLAEEQTESLETALWASLRALEDQAELARLRADMAERRGATGRMQHFTAQLHSAQAHAAAVRALLRQHGRPGGRPEGTPATSARDDTQTTAD
jgi:two-component system, chemotaxis family, protein-glutamate methylesterase/glutaminase